jgi:hypothetical protein
MAPLPSSEIPVSTFDQEGRLAFATAGGKFEERAKAAKGTGDGPLAQLLGWLATMHYELLHPDFEKGQRPGVTYDPAARFESAPDDFFATLADWAK